MSVGYEPTAGRGVRWNDPAFAIDWPASPAVINERDATYEDWK
ncbi:MAG: dTDP-4-dehydrorhamnose 3,5-epimerase family protein [Planctomycetota bacterium]